LRLRGRNFFVFYATLSYIKVVRHKAAKREMLVLSAVVVVDEIVVVWDEEMTLEMKS
jgi:hypothetical protein